MSLSVFTDVESGVRTWLRSVAPVDGRVYFSYPEGTPTLPLVTVSRLGGAPQRGEAPLEDVRITHSVWATNKKSAVDVVRSIVESYHGMQNVALDADIWGYGANVDSVVWSPDTTAKLARYVVDVTVTVRAL